MGGELERAEEAQKKKKGVLKKTKKVLSWFIALRVQLAEPNLGKKKILAVVVEAAAAAFYPVCPIKRDLYECCFEFSHISVFDMVLNLDLKSKFN